MWTLCRRVSRRQPQETARVTRPLQSPEREPTWSPNADMDPELASGRTLIGAHPVEEVFAPSTRDQFDADPERVLRAQVRESRWGTATFRLPERY